LDIGVTTKLKGVIEMKTRNLMMGITFVATLVGSIGRADDGIDVISCYQKKEGTEEQVMKIQKSSDDQYTYYTRSCRNLVFGHCIGESTITYETSGSIRPDTSSGVPSGRFTNGIVSIIPNSEKAYTFTDPEKQVEFVFAKGKCKTSFNLDGEARSPLEVLKCEQHGNGVENLFRIFKNIDGRETFYIKRVDADHEYEREGLMDSKEITYILPCGITLVSDHVQNVVTAFAPDECVRHPL
jgi:hypothetical protein